MWNNEAWAAKHIKKHGVATAEAWEVFQTCFEPLLDLSQLRFPPFRRYWTVGFTSRGRRLLVVWEVHRETKNLVTAFEPGEERIKLYERKTKKKR